MKECCKPEDDKRKDKTSKIMRWLVYAVVIGFLAFIVINQIKY